MSVVSTEFSGLGGKYWIVCSQVRRASTDNILDNILSFLQFNNPQVGIAPCKDKLKRIKSIQYNNNLIHTYIYLPLGYVPNTVSNQFTEIRF